MTVLGRAGVQGMTGPGLVFLSDEILDYNIVRQCLLMTLCVHCGDRRSAVFLIDRVLAIRTMLDIPCGDTNWQFESWETDSIGSLADAAHVHVNLAAAHVH